MNCIGLLLFCYLLFGVSAESNNTEDLDLTIPNGFLFGVATAAIQVEGAWNESGKGESIWDRYAHEHPENMTDRSNADVATDFYHKYKEDIQMIKDIGFDTFRFSLSWPRIFPTGNAKNPNPDGVRFYHAVLDELERHNITPFVTIFHWDHPQALEDQFQGWLNESMITSYVDFAKFVFKEFGPRIKHFVTINEPQLFCSYGYMQLVDKLNATSDGFYVCLHNVIKAHALAYRAYNDEFRSQQGGQVGIVQACLYYYGANRSNTLAAELGFEYNCGIVTNPIFSETGDYPELVKERVANRSRALGLSKSKLPTFDKRWLNLVKGSADFLGVNHYTSFIVETLPLSEMANWPNDEGLVYKADPAWPKSQSDWLRIVPEGLGDQLRTIKTKYNNPPVYITEFGVTEANVVKDDSRIKYFHDYCKEMLKAMREDNCNVKGAMVWSFLDSFEWKVGYAIQFGIVHVDFKDKKLKRTPKKSVEWFKSVLKSRKIQPPLPIESA